MSKNTFTFNYLALIARFYSNFTEFTCEYENFLTQFVHAQMLTKAKIIGCNWDSIVRRDTRQKQHEQYNVAVLACCRLIIGKFPIDWQKIDCEITASSWTVQCCHLRDFSFSILSIKPSIYFKRYFKILSKINSVQKIWLLCPFCSGTSMVIFDLVFSFSK